MDPAVHAQELLHRVVQLDHARELVRGRVESLLQVLEQLVSEWPLPIEELAMLGFSMGGLVCRSACHVAEAERHGWRDGLRKLVCLGSPHHGAPLERGGNWLEALMGVSRYSAPLVRLARIRSAGVTDLRYGNVLDEHWEGRDRFALAGDTRRALSLPAGVQCYAVAGTAAGVLADVLPGDGIVPVDSALGRHTNPSSRSRSRRRIDSSR